MIPADEIEGLAEDLAQEFWMDSRVSPSRIANANGLTRPLFLRLASVRVGAWGAFAWVKIGFRIVERRRARGGPVCSEPSAEPATKRFGVSIVYRKTEAICEAVGRPNMHFVAVKTEEQQSVLRWQCWWQEVFAQTAFWRAAQGALRAPVESGGLPLSLLEQFAGTARKRLLKLLRFLKPLTGGRWSAKTM